MLRLEKVTGKNAWDLIRLRVRADQRSFVAPNDQSLIEAYLAIVGGAGAFPFGIYDGDTPVGFLMIGYGAEAAWENPPGIARRNYSLWRLMIDERHQGRGYGRQAVALALENIRTFPCGPAEFCWVSYEPENERARALYRSFGFRETGDMDESEVIAALKL